MRKVEILFRVVFVCLVLNISGALYGEGTKQLQPVGTEPYYLLINRGGGLSVPFAAYTPNTLTYQAGTSSKDYRLNVKICNVGERIRLGFRAQENNTWYRIKDTSGNVVFGPVPVPYLLDINDVDNGGAGGRVRIDVDESHGFTVGDVVTITNVGGVNINRSYVVFAVNDNNTFTINSTAAAGGYNNNSGEVIYRNGNIDSYNEAVAGPRSIVGATGYLDTSFVPTDDIDYYIEFNRDDRASFLNNQITIRWYDVAVTSAANAILPGRLWSKSWHLGDGGAAFKGEFYVYADDGIVTKINNTAIQPYWFSISCNSTGVTNTGNATTDRRSVNGPQLYPQYKLFLNDPDIGCYPTGAFGNIIGTPSFGGCSGAQCIMVTVDRPGNLVILLDLNGTPGFQSGTVDLQLNATVPASAINAPYCIPWNGRNGLGAVVGSGNVPLRIDFLNGLTHLPLYDCEDNTNGYLISLVRPAGAAPRVFWDDVNITAGTATDGLTNDAVGCTAPSATVGCHRWTGRGDNACPPCSQTINSWWYANIVTSNITVPYSPTGVDANTVQAGSGIANNSFKSCTSVSNIQLNGSITTPSGLGTWSVVGAGMGTFANAANPITTYTPSAAAISAGSAILVLTANAVGTCPQDRDSLRVTFVTAATANAGSDLSICRNNPTAIFATQATTASKSPAATTALWSGGAGTYVANTTTVPLVSYTPTVAERAAAFLDLTLTVTPTDITCPAVSDVMRINFTSPPTVNAGADVTLCSNSLNLSLSGSTTGGTTTWSAVSGCGACIVTPGSLTSVYVPTVADILAGTWSLVLTSDQPNCLPVRDTVRITIGPAPTVSAGPDQSRCRNNAPATLAGSVTNLGTGTIAWTSSSGCATCFSSTTTTTPVYTPSATDLLNGSVVLTLTATKNGCAVVTDNMTINFTASPTIALGPDVTVCSNSACVNFNAVTTVASGVVWTNNGVIGTGTFTPNATSKVGTYCLTAGEIGGGLTYMVATTTGVGNCAVEDDTIFVFVNQAPTINAGPDASVCANNPTITLTGTAPVNPVGTTFQWTSLSAAGSQGVFTAATNLSTGYTLSNQEVTNGTVTLRLTATAAFCNPVTDNVVYTVTPSPTVNAGADQNNLCFNPGTVNLNGFTSTGTGIWSGGTGGTFSSNTNLNAVYSSAIGERSGTVTLTLTSTNNGLCNSVSDQVSFTFGPAHFSTPGPVTNVCANNPVIQLTGTVNTTGGRWTGGTGSYSPNANQLNTTYTPSAAEIAAGSVSFVLTTTGTGSCPDATGNITVTIAPSPTIVINGGSPITVCAGTPAATFTVTTLTGATNVSWSGGAGTFSSPTGTTVTYTPTAGEISAGSVTLTGTTTGNGACNPVTGTITINYSPIPTINAGADLVLCGNTATASLLATFTNATGVTWTHTGTGALSSSTAANPTYTPSAADKTGVVVFTATTTGTAPCTAVSDQMNLSFTVVPTVNAGPDVTVCSNAFPVQLNGSGTPATWSAGAGTFSPANTAMAGTYMPAVTSGSVTLTLTTIAFGACPSVSDQMTITISPAPTANAGTDITMCGNAASVTMAGSVTNATGMLWITNASGSISNPIIAGPTYTPSVADRAAGTVTLQLVSTGNNSNCPSDTDDVVITITPIVTVNAGPDQTLCDNGAAITMNGGVTVATGGLWTVIAGTGVLANATSVSGATYTPSVADNSFTLRLTTTGNPVGCGAIFDEVTILLSTPPTANAGGDQSICATVASVALSGSVTDALSGAWTTTGAGTFSPNNTTLITTYVPSAAEANSATTLNLTFTLTTVGNGVCPAATDVMQVSLAPRAIVSAGNDQSVCANNNVVTLVGTSSTTTGAWTTAGTGSFSAAGSLNTTYTPSAADITAGTVNITFTSTNAAPCANASDIMVIQITPAPTVNAGPDRTVCGNNAALGVIGSTTVATGGVWTTSGTGVYSAISASGLSATYTPSTPADTAAGLITLTLTSTGNGNCNAVSDFLLLTITNAPTINAGPDQTICSDSFFVELDANFSVATAGIWSRVMGTNGYTGTGNFFNANATYDTAIYVPSPADRASTGVTLRYTTTVQGTCLPVFDELVITITPAPTVNVGADKITCSNSGAVTISGVTIANQGTLGWTTSGNGTFTPNNTANTSYTPSAVDIAAGSVVLTLNVGGTNVNCRTVRDQLTLAITPLPTVNVGVDETICADRIAGGYVLTPTVANQTGVTWTSTGSGTFGPNINTQNATYFPSVADTTGPHPKTITLTMTATGNTPCASVPDSKVITFRPIPIVNAGADQTICNGSNVTLNGAVFNATGGTWSRVAPATGTISNASALSTTFVPSPADTTAGFVRLVLTSTGMGTCALVRDTMRINFRARPRITASSNFSVCANQESFQVTSLIANATGVSWTTSGTGGFSAASSNLTDYFFSPTDATNGTVTLTATTTGNAPCASVTDNVVVTFTPVPVVNAGLDINVCTSQDTLALGGSVINASGGYWATAGDGTFNNSSLNSVYTFGANDITNLSVTLVLFSSGNGACQPDQDSIVISLTPFTSVNPMPDQTVCDIDLPIVLNGSGAAAEWTTTGDGVFSNSFALNSTYTPGTNDLVAGSVNFVLTPTGDCALGFETVTYTIQTVVKLDVFAVGDTCTNATSVTLDANIGGGTWTGTGSGSFTAVADPEFTYAPSAGDRTAGNVLFTYTIPATGFCKAQHDTTTLIIHPTPVVNAGPDKVLCNNALANVTLEGSHSMTGTLLWTKLDNMGQGTLNNTTLDVANYTPNTTDTLATPVRFEFTLDNGVCSVIRDTMAVIFTPSPRIRAGNDTTVCTDKPVSLLGVVLLVASGAEWTTSGTGIFTPNGQTLNATYVPSTADTLGTLPITLTLTSTGNGICNAVTDDKIINLTTKPIVMAGIDDSICSLQTSVNVNAVVANAPGILWTTTGTGTFDDDTDPTTVYNPSPQDVANGGVILRVASTGVAVCDSSLDYKTLLIVPSPIAFVNAGFDQVICRDDADGAPMAGFILVASAAKWGTTPAPGNGYVGTGSFTPNDEDLNAIYIPSAADTANGFVVINLATTTGNGICDPGYDEMNLTITDVPHPLAGADINVCADTTQIQLVGNIISEPLLMPVAYEWVSTTGGVFTPSAYVFDPVYIPSESEKASGIVTITLNSLNNGTCNPQSDAMTITITPRPTINAGTDRTSCANVSSITMTAIATVATGVTWTTSGTGSFNPNALTATYSPSPADDAAGVVYLTATTSAGLGKCRAVSDVFELSIDPSPIVNAGANQLICADNPGVQLNGNITNAGGGFWTVVPKVPTGAGTFAPNTSNLNAVYVPSSADTAANTVSLVLTSTNNGFCLPEDDTVTFTIDPVPVVSAGTVTVCRITNGAPLNGTIGNALGGFWTTSGTGTFANLNAATIDGRYFPSLADSTAGSVVLTLTSVGNGACNAVSSTANLIITPAPIAAASPDQLVCRNAPIVLSVTSADPFNRIVWRNALGDTIGTTTAISVLPNADMFVVATVFRADGCNSNHDTVNVRVFDMPGNITLTGTRCFTDSNVITASPVPLGSWPPVPGVYVWSRNGTILGGMSGTVINPTAIGTYNVVFTAGACNVTASTPHEIYPSPISGGLDRINCVNNITTLRALNPLAGSGTTFTYQWDPNPNIITGLNSQSVDVQYNAVFDTIGFNVHITNEHNCLTEDSVYLITVEQPLTTLENDTTCPGQTIILSAVPTNYNVGTIPPIEEFLPRYVWTRNGTDLNVNNDTLVVTTDGEYIVNVILGDCVDNEDTSVVLYNVAPVLALPPNARFCDVTDSSVTISAGVTPETNKTFTYLWSPTGDVTETITTTVPGTHYVTVTSTIGTVSCDFVDSTFIKVVCSPRVHIPNVFIPGSGGPNGFFQIFGTHFANFDLRIFSRWGEVIFSATDRTEMWDGTYKGEMMPAGVYPYILIYEGETEENKGPYKVEGEILLMR